MSHLTDEQLDALVRETLGPDEQTAMMRHVDGCESCLQRLASYHERQPNIFSESALGHVANHPDYRQTFAEETKAAAAGMRATRLDKSTDVSFSLNRGKSIGTGSFGQVFEYQDSCFQRPVAFKILQDRWIGHPEVVKRFLREMEITALIDHPGCPNVYGSGKTHDGRDFFWMQLVSGSPLSEVIRSAHGSGGLILRRGNEQLRRLMAMFQQICDVIVVAHQKAIWHRDLKPANIHLHENNFPVVLDWGLATRRTESVSEACPSVPSDDSIELTRAGDQLGTMPYIAPEAARGEIHSINCQTDLYSLGGILYTMLTGEAPHAELLKSSAEPKEVLEQIGRGHQPRFDGLPKELASICRKALATQPEARYADTGELAKDVDRWLAGEPVAAHSYGITGKGILAIGRRPVTFFTATLSSAVLAILLILGSQWRQEAVQQRLVAEQRFELALEAWKTLITGVQDNLGSYGGTSKVRQKLIADATTGIQRLISDAGKQPGAELVIIQARLELAQIQRKEKGEFTEARAAYTDLKIQLESLSETHQLPERYKLLGDAIRGIYSCNLSLDGTDEANKARTEFDRYAGEFLQKFPNEPSAFLMKLQSETLAGRCEEDKGLDSLPVALNHFQSAERTLLSLPDEVRAQSANHFQYLVVLADQARILNRLGKSGQAISIQQRVVDEMTILADREPTRSNQIGLIEDRMSLANYQKSSSPEAAIGLFLAAMKSATALKENFKDDVDIISLLRDVQENLATAYRKNKEPEKAIEIFTPLVDAGIVSQLETASMDRLLDQAFISGALGLAFESADRREEAANSFRNAVEIRRAVLKRDSGNIDSLRELLAVAQAWANNVETQDAETVAYLADLCQLIGPDGKANTYAAQLKKSVAILYRWYGEHALLVAQSEQSLAIAQQAKIAYSRSKDLLGQLEGVPSGILRELDAKIHLAEQLSTDLQTEDKPK